MRLWLAAAPSSARSRWPPTWPVRGHWSTRSPPPACRPSQVWCCARPRSSARLRGAGGVGHIGAADGGHLPRRPVLSDSGHLRLHLAGRRGPGRRWMPDRALHPRPRHPALLLRRRGRGRRRGRRTSPGHEGIEDLATVSLSFVSGAEAHLTSVWHNILSRGSTRRIELFCQDGMVWLDDEFRGPLHIQTSDGTEVRPCPSPAWVEDLPLESTTRSAWPCAPTSRPTGPSSTPWLADARPSRASTTRWWRTDWSMPPTGRPPPAGCPSHSGDGHGRRRASELPRRVRSAPPSARTRGSGTASRSPAWRRAARPWRRPGASPRWHPGRRRRWWPTR